MPEGGKGWRERLKHTSWGSSMNIAGSRLSGLLRLAILGMCLVDVSSTWASDLLGTLARAESKAAAETVRSGDGRSTEQLQRRLVDARAELDRIASAEGEMSGVPADTPASEIAARKHYRQLLVAALTAQLDAADRLLASRLAAEAPAESSGLDGPPPFSIVEVDRQRQNLQAVAQKVDWLEAVQKLADRDLANAGRAHQRAKEAERRALESQESKPPNITPGRLIWLYQLAVLQSQATGAELQAQEGLRTAVAEELKQARREYRELESALVQVEDNIRFDDDDLATLLSSNDERQREIEKTLLERRAAADRERVAVADRRAELEGAENRLQVAQERLVKPTPAGRRNQRSDSSEAAVAKAREAVSDAKKRLRLALVRWQTSLSEVDTLRRLVDARHVQRIFWELRFSSSQQGGHNDAQSRDTEDAVRRLLELLKEPDNVLRQALQLNLDQAAIIQDRLRDARPDEASFLRQQLEILNAARSVQTKARSEVTQLRLLISRWVQDFDKTASERSASARVGILVQEAKEAMLAAWGYEITSIDDTAVVDGQTIAIRRPVTVGKVSVAIVVLVLGFLLARKTARLVERQTQQRLGIAPQAVRTASNWILSGVFVVLVIISLAIVRIPITVFAFLGGAVAIGAGFGMQNLLKNLMSGLMLLAERPFKLGDLVDVGGMRGVVTDIGVRASTLRNVDGIETLVPNATFIEQNVTNWTYTSGTVRFAVTVGVAYGSPVRVVSDLLLDIARRHGRVLKDPVPEVLFESFDADALSFGLYVWLDLNTGVSGRVVCSDIRYMIERAFSDAGISIAFPQRDVHLDTSRPLEVRVLQS